MSDPTQPANMRYHGERMRMDGECVRGGNDGRILLIDGLELDYYKGQVTHGGHGLQEKMATCVTKSHVHFFGSLTTGEEMPYVLWSPSQTRNMTHKCCNDERVARPAAAADRGGP
jgi:hypothetical protein